MQKIGKEIQYTANGNSANNDDAVDYTDSEMGGLCETLYESSAHCNKKYATFNREDLSERDWKLMQLSCSYIDSIVLGN
jgi:hypothetical protein